MSYARGFLNRRVTVLERQEAIFGDYGRKGGDFVPVTTIWANCTFTKGVKAMREGALDAYDVYMVRCDCHKKLTRDCRLSFGNRIYQITSFNEDREQNEVQMICQEMIKQ